MAASRSQAYCAFERGSRCNATSGKRSHVAGSCRSFAWKPKCSCRGARPEVAGTGERNTGGNPTHRVTLPTVERALFSSASAPCHSAGEASNYWVGTEPAAFRRKVCSRWWDALGCEWTRCRCTRHAVWHRPRMRLAMATGADSYSAQTQPLRCDRSYAHAGRAAYPTSD
jgi:hypothetical protein